MKRLLLELLVGVQILALLFLGLNPFRESIDSSKRQASPNALHDEICRYRVSDLSQRQWSNLSSKLRMQWEIQATYIVAMALKERKKKKWDALL